MSQKLLYELNGSVSEHEVNVVARELTRALNEINSESNTYQTTGENVGYRNANGTKQVELEDGKDFLQKLTPKSPCNMEFEIRDTKIIVRMTHHDSPMGETHTITAPKT